MNYCSDCGWRNINLTRGNKYKCDCPKLCDDTYGKTSCINDDDALTYEYDEGGGFYVGISFGCVHWKP